MLSRIVECVPNFSEARRPEVIEKIIERIKSVPSIYILDQHSDIDHNRTVITFVGEPEAVAEASFQAILTASKLIDLNLHQGEHPRIGATDVVPFIPIRNVTMQECIEMARDLGQRVGNELGIPVYLYEEASTRPERKDLENIRRGEYEQLKAEIGIIPERQPDFGPSKLGTAGATAIGARQFLVAFNVFLNTDDIRVAQKIAKSIRNSSGGWHFVKAKGFLVEGRAQVSMNFTNFRLTSLARVVETIRREAERFGFSILRSELVGLIPQQALADAASWYLQLDEILPQQIFEHHLFEMMCNHTAERPNPYELEFLDRLSSSKPAQGRESAASLTAASAAALLAKAARFSMQNASSTAEIQMRTVVEQAEELRDGFSRPIIQVTSLSQKLDVSPRLLHDDHEKVEIQDQGSLTISDLNSMNDQLDIDNIVSIFELAEKVAENGIEDILVDVAIAVSLARGAFSGVSTLQNMYINSHPDQNQAQKKRTHLENRLSQTYVLENHIRATLLERGKILLT